MTDLSDLISRVRKAQGPDRTIDLLILALVAQAGEWGTVDIEYALRDIEGTTAPPHFTSSLDAITALIEKKLPGWHVYSTTVGEQDMPQACLTEPEGDCRDFVAHHVSEALARAEAFLLSLQEISK